MVTTFNKLKDDAYSTLASGISASDTTFSYATGEGSRFPTPPYKVVIGKSEIVKVTGQSGDSVTSCLRGQDGTTAQAWDAGTLVEIQVIASDITDLQTATNNLEAQFDPSTGHDHDGTDSKKVSWDNLDSKPSSFPPSAHTHPGSDVTSQVSDSDKVDGQHASAFASASHTHTKSNITDLETITTTPTASAVPKADASGKLDNGWLKTGSGNGLDADKVDGKDAPSGDIVGTSDTQTLTNKTLTKPTIQGSVPNVRSYSPDAGTTCTLDLSDANVHVIQMPAGNITIALSNVSVGQIFSIEIIQDSTGGRTVTWFNSIRWVSGSAPTLSTGSGKKDCFVFRCTSSGNYDGYIAGQDL